MLDRITTRTLLIVACACACSASALPPPAPPVSDEVVITRAKPATRSLARMDFARKYHDFGAMMDDESHHTEFKFTNTGSEPLEILNIRADCGCTVPEMDKKRYEPGESGTVNVTLNPEGKSGSFERRVTILTNDANGASELVIAAAVTPIVEVVPQVVTVGSTDRSKTITRTLSVTGRTDDFEVTGAIPRAGEQFSAKVLGTESITTRFGEKVRRSTIEVTFHPTYEIGEYNAQLEITTNDPRRPIVRTQMIARILGDIYPTPRNLGFRGAVVGKTETRKIRLNSRSGEAFKVLGAEFGQGNFSGDIAFEPINPEKPEAGWLLTVVATPSVSESRLMQELLVTTDIKGEETVRIDLRGVVIDAK